MRPVGRRVGAALVAASALVLVLTGCADDPPPMRTIAVLRAVAAGAGEASFVPALADLGFPPGQVRVLGGDEIHADPEAAEAAVRGWIAQGAELVVALSTRSAQAAARATETVPILFLVNDPRVAGLLTDERNPEANLTGATYRVPADRVLTRASEALGPIDQVGCIHPVADPGIVAVRQELERGAATHGMSLRCESYDDPNDAGGAVTRLLAAGVDVILPLNAPGTVEAFPQIERALEGSTVPLVSTTPWDAAVLTLVPDGEAVFGQMAGQAARLLEGDAVAEVPVEDPASYRLTVNLAVARRLGIVVPESILDRADSVVR